MTAELVIMNKKAVAIAADSAMTTMGKKVFSSENKIFQLSRYEPVAILLWDSANFMGIPFELLIKKYRKDVLNSKSYSRLYSYFGSFCNYLQNSEDLYSEDQEKSYITSQINAYYEVLTTKIQNLFLDKINSYRGYNTLELMNEAANEVINTDYELFNNKKNLDSIKPIFLEKYKNIINQENKKIQEKKFRDIIIDEEKLQKNIISIFIKAELYDQPYKIKTGVAVCGYGNSEIFPSLKSSNLYGVLGKTLLFEEEHSEIIDHNKESCIRGFAQTEMIESFLFGIHPFFYNEIIEMISKILESFPETIIKPIKELTEDQKAEYLRRWNNKNSRTELSQTIQNNLFYKSLDMHYHPILNIVKILPKDELANMAEVLINLTSFKRRLSFEAETVGGPIDVAVLSRGDGFVWIKRKHYFSRELNQQYFVNYERGYKNVQSRRKKRSDTE